MQFVPEFLPGAMQPVPEFMPGALQFVPELVPGAMRCVLELVPGAVQIVTEFALGVVQRMPELVGRLCNSCRNFCRETGQFVHKFVPGVVQFSEVLLGASGRHGSARMPKESIAYAKHVEGSPDMTASI